MRSLPSRKPRARVLVAAAVVALLTIVVLEIGVRLLGLAPPIDTQFLDNTADAYLPFKPRPLSRATGRAATGEFSFDYQHNRYGFRDVEHTPHKSPGVFRIVALGDSFTYGAGAEFDETYLSQLEHLLNRRPAAAKKVEVIRLGLPRYFPAAERLVLQHYGLAYQPDLVMVGILPNDIFDTYLGLEGMGVGPLGVLLSRRGQQLGSAGVVLYLRSHLARSFLNLWSAYANSPAVRPSELFEAGGPHAATWAAMEADLAWMAETSRRHGADFALVSIPQAGLAGRDNAEMERRMKLWSAAHKVAFIPTLAAFRDAAAKGAVLHWQRDGHCTAAGNRVIAQQIFDVLTLQGVVR